MNLYKKIRCGSDGVSCVVEYQLDTFFSPSKHLMDRALSQKQLLIKPKISKNNKNILF